MWRTTSWPPTKRVTTSETPRTNSSVGQSMAMRRARRRERRMYSRLEVSKAAIWASSWANARMRRAAEKFSSAWAEMSENMAWMRSKRVWMRAPKYCTKTDAKGRGRKAKSVRRGLILSMKGSAKAMKTMVLAEYMMAGPRSWRTALRSLVECAMMSPVRWRW